MAIAALALYGRRPVLKYLVTAGDPALFDSHSSQPVPEKAEPIPPDAEFDPELSAWAQKQNIALDQFMRVVLKTIHG